MCVCVVYVKFMNLQSSCKTAYQNKLYSSFKCVAKSSMEVELGRNDHWINAFIKLLTFFFG